MRHISRFRASVRIFIGQSMSVGNTLDFMLSAKRNAQAAQRFFRKALNSTHNQPPRVINVDKNAVITPRN